MADNFFFGTGESKAATLVYLGALLVVMLLVLVFFLGLDATPLMWVWAGAAAVLGLLSGYVTGATEQAGAGTAFLGFVGTGIIVPLAGGVVALLQKHDLTTETTDSSTASVVKKVTETVSLDPSDSRLQPLAVLAVFFVVYGFFAAVGMRLGVVHREGCIGLKIRA